MPETTPGRPRLTHHDLRREPGHQYASPARPQPCLTNTEAPKSTDLRLHDAQRLAAVAAELNTRPRKTLGWDTPAARLTLCG
jgi:hypothetical protein